MSSNLPLVHRSHRVLPFFIKFSIYGRGGRKLETKILPQQIDANSNGGAYNQMGRNVE